MTTKVVCNFVLPGSVMLAPSECDNSVHPSQAGCYKHQSVRIFDKKKNKYEYVDYYVRNTRDAYQSLNISDIAFDWMTGPDSYFEVNCNRNDWKKMTEYMRLDAHISLLSKYFNAKSYTFEILPD